MDLNLRETQMLDSSSRMTIHRREGAERDRNKDRRTFLSVQLDSTSKIKLETWFQATGDRDTSAFPNLFPFPFPFIWR